MGLTKAQLTERSVNKMIAFIKEHGKKNKNIYIWDKRPIVIQDICTDGVMYDGETVWFVDIIGKDFKKRKNISQVIHRSFIDECLEDMK